MSKNNIEILESFLKVDISVLESNSAEILQVLSSVVDTYLEGETEDVFNNRIEQILSEDNSHAEYLRDLIADIYFEEDTNNNVKSKILILSSTHPLIKQELEFRTDIRKLYLLENRTAFKEKLQGLTKRNLVESPAANVNRGVSYFKSLAIAASVLLVVIVGYSLFRTIQPTQIAKVEYKRIPISVIGIEEIQGFAGNETLDIDSCIIAIVKDSVNSYKYWNDTLILKTNIKVDSLQIIRKIKDDNREITDTNSISQNTSSALQDKTYLKINDKEYQIVESEVFLKITTE
ncbi:MAG: hypothetical protein KDC60_07710 [Bacteroidetes bacterium]|nr:hypothetical protein [Bacteroidota bacterium]MCB9074260.1 hypothetical protein [Chitinophagales bacterium]